MFNSLNCLLDLQTLLDNIPIVSSQSSQLLLCFLHLDSRNIVDWTLGDEKEENQKGDVENSKDKSEYPVVQVFAKNLNLIHTSNLYLIRSSEDYT